MADLNGSPTLIHRALRVGLAVGAVVLVLVAGALLYRAWRQHENSVALAIDQKTGVEETMFVPSVASRNGYKSVATIAGIPFCSSFMAARVRPFRRFRRCCGPGRNTSPS